MVTAGAAVEQAGAEVAGTAVPRPRYPRSRPHAGSSGLVVSGPPSPLAVGGPLSFRTIPPQRYPDTRFDGGGPFPPRRSVGKFLIFDFGNPLTTSPAPATRSCPRPGRSSATSSSPAAPRAEPARVPGRRRRDLAGLQPELDGRSDGGQRRHRRRRHPGRRRRVHGQRRPGRRLHPRSVHVTSTSAGTSSRPGARWPGPASSVGQLPGFAGASADP